MPLRDHLLNAKEIYYYEDDSKSDSKIQHDLNCVCVVFFNGPDSLSSPNELSVFLVSYWNPASWNEFKRLTDGI